MDSFPQFSRLPLELRRLIWLQCLPRRIAEEDVPYTLLDGKDSRQACWPNRTTFQNARVPLIGSVNSEARQVVFEWGMTQKSQDSTSLHKIWLQPKIDTALHLNWTRRRDHAFYQVFDAYIPDIDEAPLAMLIHRACWEYGMQASLVADVVNPFDLRELSIDNVLIPMSSEANRVRISDVQDEMIENLHQIIASAVGQTISMTLIAISLHVDKKIALGSGLFGLLGDAPVQTVDFDDVLRLHQFYDLYKSDPSLKEAEPEVDRIFNAILSQRFRAAVNSWHENARWLLQVAVWKSIRQGQPESFGDQDPGLVWKPPVHKEQYFMCMNEHKPDEENTWWQQYAERITPKILPQIMVRLCDNQCYRDERRPEGFGDAWFTANRPGDEASP